MSGGLDAHLQRASERIVLPVGIFAALAFTATLVWAAGLQNETYLVWGLGSLLAIGTFGTPYIAALVAGTTPLRHARLAGKQCAPHVPRLAFLRALAAWLFVIATIVGVTGLIVLNAEPDGAPYAIVAGAITGGYLWLGIWASREGRAQRRLLANAQQATA